MKWTLRILLILSLALNGYFIADEIRDYQIQEMGKALNRQMGNEITKTTWEEGLSLFTERLKKEHPALQNKKYYYINVWINWCKPCIREMPWLDSLAGTIDKEVGYFFVSEMTDSLAQKSIEHKGFQLKNFVLLNDMNAFVSAACNKRGIKNKIYPMVLILSNSGELVYFSTGAYSNVQDAIGFEELMKGLK